MKRIPVATLMGVLCLATLSVFTLNRAAAERALVQQPASTVIRRPAQTIIKDDGTTSTTSDEGENDFVPGEILVKFRNESDAIEAGRGIRNAAGHLRVPNARLSSIFARFGIKDGRRTFANAKLRSLAKVVKLTAEGRRTRADLGEVLESLRAQPEVEYAELNVIMHTQTVPNDAYYSTSAAWGQAFRDLWGLPAINTESAWDTSQGDGVVVAVVDTGLDYNHEDIVGNVWQNDGETGLDGSGNDKRFNGVDDDGDGLVDDWRGWDFVTIDGTPADNNPMDNHGHGTHVSGTIAATGNNGLGVIGVAPHAKIMALKGLDANGSGSTEDLSTAIIYAADRGASVINASWGGSGDTPQTLIDAISYAHDVKNVVVVAAAGNFNADVGTQNQGFYPACIRDVVAVAAINHLNAKASFSNFGAKIDVAAPGGGDTDPNGQVIQPDRSILSLLSSAAGGGITGSGQLIVGTKYLRQAGTSMASPHVAGVAALIRALHPEFSPEQVRQALRSGADDIGAVGFDTQFGYGRVNAARPLTNSAPLVAQLKSPTGTLSGLSQVDVKGSVGGTNLSSWRLEYGAGTAPSSWTLINTSTATINNDVLVNWNLTGMVDGTYTLHLVAQSTTGELYEDRLKVVVDGLVITDPSPLSVSITRGGVITIRGTVASANFARYSIGILAIANNTWVSSSAITLANGGLQPVHDDVLGTWDTTGAIGDTYQIYVTEIFSNNSSVFKSVKIAVDPTLHPGWPIDIGLFSTGAASMIVTNHIDAYDVDGNGTKELLVAYPDKVSIFDHTGAQLPGWPQAIDPANSGAHIQISPAVADLDGDGSPEILAANDQGKVFIWRPDGTLWSGWPKNIGGYMTNIAVDDLDGDGQKEIVMTTYGSVRVYNTSGTSRPGFPVFTNTLLTPPAIGDVDGDGQKEIAAAAETGPSNLYLIKANGAIMPGWPRAINPSLPSNFISNSNPSLGDLDGDGKMECVIGSTDGLVYAFRYDGSYLPGWPQATKPAYVNTPVIGDIDGDGLPEVVAGNDKLLENGSWSNYLFAWHANGTILPNWPIKYDRQIGATSFGYGAPALADLDQDGRADVIVSSDTKSGSYSPVNAYKSDGSKVPGFPKPTLNTAAAAANTVAVADLDGDGLLEMAWLDVGAKLYVWDLNAPTTAVAPWPMFQHDERHTGASLRTPEVIAPTAAITSPAAGTRVAGVVNVTAEATDNVGVVNVELYKDDVLVGSSTSSPYTYNWDSSTDADGPHSFVSKAYDAAGNIGTSVSIVLIVDNTAPTASVTAPAAGTRVAGVVNVTAEATDNVGVVNVEFYKDDVLVGSSTSSPYTYNWHSSTDADGPHSFLSKAYDAAGNVGTSASIALIVDNTAPTASVTEPASGAMVTGSAVVISASGSDSSGVQKVDFYRDNQVLLGTDTSAPFSITWNSTSVPGGAHSLYVVATDTLGNSGSSPAISVSVENSPPSVAVTNPANGGAVTGVVSLAVNATDDGGVQKVQYFRDANISLGTSLTAPFNLSWDSTTVTTGAHTMYAIATDLVGNTTTSSTVSFTVDRTVPSVSMTAPSGGSLISGTAVTVSANASDNIGIGRVDFYRDGNVLVGSDNSSPYSISWNTTSTPSGAHTLNAVAVDIAGNTKTSNNVNVTVDNTGPTASVSAPANGAFVMGTVTISVAASDNVAILKVEFYRDSNVLLATDTGSPYSYNWSSITVPDGAHTLYAIAQDKAGNRTTSASISITVDNTPPTVVITGPANGAQFPRNTTVNIDADAADNFGVVKVEFYVGNTLTCTDTVAPYSCIWQVPDKAANYTLKATAYDAAGKTSTHTISVSSK